MKPKLNFLNLFILSLMILGFVSLVLAGYAAVYRSTAIGDFIGLDSGGVLDLFDKTFGLAAGLVIALVAVVLAMASLEISRSQSALAERQARLELDMQLTQIALGSPAIGKEAVARAKEAVDAAADIMRGVTTIQAKIIDGQIAYKMADREAENRDNETGVDTERQKFELEVQTIIDEVRAPCTDETGRILTASKRIVGFIARHADETEREAALQRHFGSFFEVMSALFEQRLKMLEDDAGEEQWINSILAIQEPERRKIAILGYLTSVNKHRYFAFDDGLISKGAGGPAPAICADLQLEVLSGRYVDLFAALEVMAKDAPVLPFHFTHDNAVHVAYIAALVAVALDLANPYRLVGQVKLKLESLQTSEAGPDPRLKAATLDSILQYIDDHMPYARSLFNRDGKDMASGRFAALPEGVFVEMRGDADGEPYPHHDLLAVEIYPQTDRTGA